MCWKERSKYGATFGVEIIACNSDGRISAGCKYESRMSSTPGISAKSGNNFSINVRSPRSFPYEVVFSLTKKSSLTPLVDNQRASSNISVGRRETNAPRKYGIAQKEQRRSQPDAIFSGAHGALPKRLRRREPPAPKAD
ncbi:unannotated protein [freshwater metagenome]|uniref:Unannotated protein n=1 Tax=freshwater metagenome TaxID=449393 RepID=A0A6J7AAM3_9ZZZZ